MKHKLLFALLLLMGVSSLTAQTATNPPADSKRPKVVRETRFVMLADWFQTGMLIEVLEMTPTLRFFEPKLAAAMLPKDWEAEQRHLVRLDELRTAELASFDSVKPPERILGESTTTVNGATRKNITVFVGPVSPEVKAPPESIALGQALISSIQGRLGDDPNALWQFNFGRHVNLALLNSDSHNNALRLKGVEVFRDFMKTAPLETDPEIFKIADEFSAIVTEGMFKPEDALKVTPLFSKVSSIIEMQSAGQKRIK